MSNDEIYFGSKNCFFVNVLGKTIPFDISHWKESTDIEKVLERNHPIIDKSMPHMHVVLPAIPALDIISNVQLDNYEDSNLPSIFRLPLLKILDEDQSANTFKGKVSGIRSGLIKIDNEWYRLKGCGNEDKGFIVRNNQNNNNTWCDIRGCAFPHTALRELMMQHQLVPYMNSNNLVCCNMPIAMMLYESPEQLPLGCTFPTACIVSKTIGDRRFGSHVMAGLEIILPLLINETGIELTTLLQLFPSDRPMTTTKDNLLIPSNTNDMISDFCLNQYMKFNSNDIIDFEYVGSLTQSDFRIDRQHLADLTLSKENQNMIANLECAPNKYNFPKQYTRTTVSAMQPSWQNVWTNECEVFQCLLNEIHSTNQSMPSVLTYFFSRTGYDSGRILKAVHASGTSWGTYRDYMCHEGQWHCNAHSNNLVLVPETHHHTNTNATAGANDTTTDTNTIQGNTETEESLLCMLDLDMAFNRSSYVSMETGEVGQTVEEFNRLLWYENCNMLEVLMNCDCSSGVPMLALGHVEQAVGERPSLQLVKSALYDTMALSYLRGYSGDDCYPVCAYCPLLHRAAHSLARLAITVMADFVA